MPTTLGRPLADLSAGDQAVVMSIPSSHAGLLRYLASLGMLPGAELAVLAISPFDDNIHLKVKGQEEPAVLGPQITRVVLVEVRTSDLLPG